MTEVLLDALLDTLKLFPWLLLIYIVIELIEHKTKLTGSHNRLSGRLGPFDRVGDGPRSAVRFFRYGGQAV